MKMTLERAKELMAANDGNLDLYGNEEYTELPEELEVPGFLDLRYSKIIGLSKKLIVGGSFYLEHTAIEQLPDYLTVGGLLNLSYTAIKKLPNNLIVGGSLYVQSTFIKELPDNLTVGGWLYIYDTAIDHVPNNLTVGGKIFCHFDFDESEVKRLKDGDYVEGEYIYADGILTHVKKCHKVNGYIFYVGKFKGRNVISDGKNFAHCRTFREGVADLLFKSSKDGGASQYANVSLDDEFTVSELITMNRIITGACKQGSESFVESIKELKETCIVRKAIQLTDG